MQPIAVRLVFARVLMDWTTRCTESICRLYRCQNVPVGAQTYK
nr:MAG TPA: putative lipoprotein [Bacteriophage sp.]